MPAWDGIDQPSAGRVVEARFRYDDPEAPATDYDRSSVASLRDGHHGRNARALPGGIMNDYLRSRLDLARTLYAPLQPDHDIWLTRIDEIEQLALRGDAGAAQRLVELASQYSTRLEQAHHETMAAFSQGRSAVQREPHMTAELAVIASLALGSLGAVATDAVMAVYSAETPGSRRRHWALHVLSQLGDPRLERFFDQLHGTEDERQLAESGLRVIRAKSSETEAG